MRASHQEFHRLTEELLLRLIINEDSELNRRLDRIEQTLNKIMATQAELAAQLNDLGAELGKIGAETQSLLDKIEELGKIIAAGGDVTPELQAAFDAVKAQAQAVDDKVPDAPAPEA